MNPRHGQGTPNGKKNGFTVRGNYRNLADRRWSDVGVDVLTELVVLCTNAGAAIMFGRTSDGGALSICILDGDSKIKDYFREPEDVESFLAWLKDEVFAQTAPVKIVK